MTVWKEFKETPLYQLTEKKMVIDTEGWLFSGDEEPKARQVVEGWTFNDDELIVIIKA